MPNTLTVGSPVKVRIWTRVLPENQAAVNTIYYIVAAVGSPAASDLDVATQIDATIAPHYKALLSGVAEYRGVQAQILNTLYPYKAFYSAAGVNTNAGAGTGAATLLPSQTCGLISFQTARAGRAFRGRFYAAFPSQGMDSGGGSPTAGYITNLTTLTGDVDTGLSIVQGGRTATLVRVILHKKDKSGVVPDPSPVIAASVSELWATQRRRGNFGRHNDSPL